MAQAEIRLPDARGGVPQPDATPTVPAPDIADPGPLGLAGFAMTTFCLSVFNAGLLDVRLEAVVLPLALFYGGIAQMLAGMWEFKKANTFGALAFTSYGAFWLALATYSRFVAPGLPPTSRHLATGLFLLAWTIFTAYMFIGSLRISGGLIAVFAVLLLTFIALTWGAFAEATGLTRLGGWLGILTALLAWYTSAAGVINPTWGRKLLPTMPVKR
ncbi:MAG TPA: acetate uptake transporter [Mycobacteriales bacterium]|nr:acetate uptake transporter [Mycobacteriales bacterium]